ncbi:electron transport complex subunit RsxG [Agaribacterium haliotis]|uniref:electron transport complex subunit RsxG n=1 Tax=Agaribacterium haliotis TaxID=2013869 RepID=UPI000BB54EB7|nr:electron transport complex subunit RsxG [Agaribacterium haliotis]
MTSNLAVLREKISYQTMVLATLCALVTVVLVLVQLLTADSIKQRLIEDRLFLLNQVLPAELYNNQPFDEHVFISDSSMSPQLMELFVARKNAELSAFVFEIETQAYGGKMVLLIAIDRQGQILGLRTLSHKETPGLADKIEIEKSDWILSFNGESLERTSNDQWAVKKDGGKFDQFTGATITPRAVVNVVKQALEFYARNKHDLLMQLETKNKVSHLANSEGH